MKKYISIFCLLIIAVNIQAQETNNVKFSNITSGGLLSGQSQNLFTIQTINGVKYKTWFAGIGAAYDTYGYKSIPVFIDIRKNFGNKNWQPFIYADAGINFSLYSTLMPRKINGTDQNKFYPTFYGETGLGISKVVSRKVKLVLSTGFSYKEFSYLEYNDPIYLYPSFSAPQSAHFDFNYRRFSIKAGLQF